MLKNTTNAVVTSDAVTATGLTLGSQVEVREGDETIIPYGEVDHIVEDGNGETYITVRMPDGSTDDFHEMMVFGL